MQREMRFHGLIDISEDRGQHGQATAGRMESAGWAMAADGGWVLWQLRVVGYLCFRFLLLL